jgi:hypothetical protein
VPLLVHSQIDTMGYGEHHVTSPEGRYGSVHSTISENENTGSGIKDVCVSWFASCSLLVLRIHFLGLQVRLCTTFSGISAGGCIRPCVREKKRQTRE